MVDGGALFYRCYRTADGKYYGRRRHRAAVWFASRTRDEWAEIFAGTDARVTPVLPWSEAANDMHITARATVINTNGVEQAAPVLRFSRTPAGSLGSPPAATTSLDELGC
jgi:alpha-methylacyl-CoA racemase